MIHLGDLQNDPFGRSPNDPFGRYPNDPFGRYPIQATPPEMAGRRTRADWLITTPKCVAYTREGAGTDQTYPTHVYNIYKHLFVNMCASICKYIVIIILHNVQCSTYASLYIIGCWPYTI